MASVAPPPSAFERREIRAAMALSERSRADIRLTRSHLEAGASPVEILELLGGVPARPARLRDLDRRGIRVVRYAGPGYPPRLWNASDFPLVLHLKGPGSPDPKRAIAIIGARRATDYGRRVARDLAADLAAAGVGVVSGLAMGIDSAAHRGALDADGPTIGVLGSGLDHVSPPGNRRLFERVAERGALVSEFPPDVRPAPFRFPQRNRIIAGLADGVVVVQAGARSGTSITVGFALELGRTVMGVPGPIGLPASEGVHRLLREGAHIVTSASEVCAAMGWPGGVDSVDPAVGLVDRDERAIARRTILAALDDGTATADELAERSGLPIGPALALVSRLELEGWIEALPGCRYGPGRTARQTATR